MSGILGGGGGGNSQQLLALEAIQQAQLQKQMTDNEGRQLALASQQQAINDNSAASLAKTGLGRAMLSSTKRSTLGG
jgi:hypothetical protein